MLTDSLGWRWCFYVGVPFAIAAFVVLQRTLHLPRRRREVQHRLPRHGADRRRRVGLLIWVSLAGQQYDWLSWQSAALVASASALLGRRRRSSSAARASR